MTMIPSKNDIVIKSMSFFRVSAVIIKHTTRILLLLLNNHLSRFVPDKNNRCLERIGPIRHLCLSVRLSVCLYTCVFMFVGS